MTLDPNSVSEESTSLFDLQEYEKKSFTGAPVIALEKHSAIPQPEHC